MFKKPFDLGNSHKLSGGDRKKLRKDLQIKFRCDDAQLDELLPAKGGELEVAKFAASKGQVYTLDRVPLIVDLTGKADFFPCVFALWKVPSMLPNITLKHAAVSQFLIGGADLMLPGVSVPEQGFPKFRDWEFCCVLVPGNPAPVAMGRACLSSDKATERVQAGAGGKLLEIYHCFGDKLWELGAAAGAALPEGFKPDVVLPLGYNPDDQPEHDPEGEEDEEEAGAAGVASSQLTTEAPRVDDAEIAGQSLGGERLPDAQPDASMASADADAEGLKENAGGAAPAMRAEDMDALLRACLLQTLRTRVSDKELPMAGSALWALMLQCRPPGAHLDLKSSTFKKVSKFLQAQKDAGLIDIKVDKHSNETNVQRVRRDNQLYTSFHPYKTVAETASSSAEPATSPAVVVHTTSTEGTLSVQQRFRVGRELAPIFTAGGLDPDALYGEDDARRCLVGYVQAERLDQGTTSSSRIALNAALGDALFKGLLKKGETYPPEMEMKDALSALMRRMHPVNLLRRGDVEVVKKGALAPVQVCVRSFGKKKVTMVTGLETFLLDPAACSKDFAKRFACSSGVEKLVGPKVARDVFEVKIQGDIPDKVAECLRSTWNIPKQFVVIK